MTDADKPKFAAQMAAVYALYRADLSQGLLEMWWRALQTYDLESIARALTLHTRNADTGQFIPKPADVVRELGGTSADASMLAFQRAMDGLRAVGTYETVLFDDPITNRVLVDLGGWAWLGRQQEKELPFIEKRFRDAYRAYRQRGMANVAPVQRLPGIFEQSDALNAAHRVERKVHFIGDAEKCKLLLEGKQRQLERDASESPRR